MANYFDSSTQGDDIGFTSGHEPDCKLGHAASIKRKSIPDLLNVKKYDKHSMLIRNRLLAGVGLQFKALNPLNHKEEQWYIRLSQALEEPCDTSRYLCLEGNNSQYWISDGADFLGNLTGIHLGESQAAMLSMLLPKVPQPLQDVFGWQIVSSAVAPEDLVVLDLHYGSDDLGLKTSLAMTKSTCLQVINQRAFRNIAKDTFPETLKIKANVVLGSINLGILEANQLEVGDLLFFKDNNFGADGSGILPLGPLNLSVTIELANNQYQLKINRWEKNMSEEDTNREDEELISDDMEVTYDDHGDDSNPEEGDREEVLPIGDLPISVDVRLGSVNFTVKDLHNLVEGKLYTINSPDRGLVQLTHNDLELARGQLVEVDGKLAIEIQKRWLHS
ncbi:hypothetical protein FKG94_05290 [Exilibacterium tricleocarpae]|uniref:Flagellar motor switch protein FliN-like C-terminal domain-containing protein n=1 Tax=Exilibacterium tricleocarpae TaxID=2591008 RepID=A0A545U3N1_9GAMM|nr:FliM/FliN family flagellar motor switch protein [Exilibacterium tricleocarpae]TQV84082.1 hypothetical protein FKG94_05290 [Exilibacterium tricleocarpae]